MTGRNYKKGLKGTFTFIENLSWLLEQHIKLLLHFKVAYPSTPYRLVENCAVFTHYAAHNGDKKQSKGIQKFEVVLICI